MKDLRNAKRTKVEVIFKPIDEPTVKEYYPEFWDGLDHPLYEVWNLFEMEQIEHSWTELVREIAEEMLSWQHASEEGVRYMVAFEKVTPVED